MATLNGAELAARRAAQPGPRRFDVWTLTRWRTIALRNLFDQQLRESPWRTLITLALLLFIWAALYFVLRTILSQVQSWGLVAVVANQQIFIHFFLVLAIMLAFSNAVLAFGSMYGRSEPAHLLSLPVLPRHFMLVKWVEGMFLSSWSFLLLGVPLMMAVASNEHVAWYYYPLFIGHFVGFVAIPGTLGVLAAWAVAMWAPRRPAATAIWLACMLLLVTALWLANVSRNALESEDWIKLIFAQISIARQPWLPHTWTANGIVAAVEQRIGDSLFYLLVVLGNAAFLAWLTINVVSWRWAEAYSRAQQGRFKPIIRRGWFTQALCFALFFYLPGRLRTVMLKDLRGFARDPRQWTQMAIMFGLLVVYVLNLRAMPVDLHQPGIKGLIAFLNLTVVSLILATFTSRFVYPLLSLESQQLWLLGLLPARRLTLLLVKFLFALTVTGLSAVIVMLLAVNVLELPPAWGWLHLTVCISVCIGLCGLSVGLGARFPVFGQRNPARIASGFGGTFNLILSMLFVFVQMAGVALLSLGETQQMMTLPEELRPGSLLMAGVLLGVGIATAAAALIVGARNFARLEY